MLKVIQLVALLIVIGIPLTVSAEIREGTFEVTPSAGIIVFDGSENLNRAAIFGIKGGYNVTKNIGLELGFEYFRSRITHERDLTRYRPPFGGPYSAVRGFLLHADVLYHFMPQGRLNPFILVGVGGAKFDPDSDAASKNRFIAEAGVGAKYWLTDATALRLDIKDVVFFIDHLKHQYHNLVSTVGLVVALGGKDKPLPPPPPLSKPEPKPEPKPIVAPKPAPKPMPKPEPKPEPAPAPMPEARKIILEDVHFDFDKATLTDAAKAILNKNIKAMKENPGVNLIIEGHTCAHGAADYNMRLSERRANAVREYLVKEGAIGESRLSAIAYGETKLLMPEKPTSKNMQSTEAKANRRVHFEVVVK